MVIGCVDDRAFFLGSNSLGEDALFCLFFLGLCDLIWVVIGWKCEIRPGLALGAYAVGHARALVLISYQPLLVDETVGSSDWEAVGADVEVEEHVVNPISFLGLILHI